MVKLLVILVTVVVVIMVAMVMVMLVAMVVVIDSHCGNCVRLCSFFKTSTCLSFPPSSHTQGDLTHSITHTGATCRQLRLGHRGHGQDRCGDFASGGRQDALRGSVCAGALGGSRHRDLHHGVRGAKGGRLFLRAVGDMYVCMC